MPGIEIGLSPEKKKKDPSANLFLIKHLTCQNCRQLMFLCFQQSWVSPSYERAQWAVLGTGPPSAGLTNPRFTRPLIYPCAVGSDPRVSTGRKMPNGTGIGSWGTPIPVGLGVPSSPSYPRPQELPEQKRRFCGEKPCIHSGSLRTFPLVSETRAVVPASVIQ